MAPPARFRRGASSGGHGDVRLELWVQPGTVDRGELGGVLERLRRLERRGAVDSVAVETWDRLVDLSADVDEEARRARRRIAGFAGRAGAGEERSPGTGAVRVCVGRMGPERLAWRTPPAALVEFRDRVPVRVTPGSGATASICRRLDELDRELCALDRPDDREARPRTPGGSRNARRREGAGRRAPSVGTR